MPSVSCPKSGINFSYCGPYLSKGRLEVSAITPNIIYYANSVNTLYLLKDSRKDAFKSPCTNIIMIYQQSEIATSLIPRPLPAFQCCTLKSERAWPVHDGT